MEAYAARRGQMVEASTSTRSCATAGRLVTPKGAGAALVELMTQASADVASAYLLSGDGLKRLP